MVPVDDAPFRLRTAMSSVVFIKKFQLFLKNKKEKVLVSIKTRGHIYL